MITAAMPVLAVLSVDALVESNQALHQSLSFAVRLTVGSGFFIIHA